mgnify:CR=1 FL=1
MNQYIWAIDEIEMIRTHPSLCGVSSFMPQKCDSGSIYEKVRMAAADVIGEANKLACVLKGEPHMDVLPAMGAPNFGTTGMTAARRCIRMFTYALEHGYGGRLAHSIVATMVRQARERGLKACECTGEMLDEAAAYLDRRKPGLDTATLRRCLDPVEYVNAHDRLGGTSPRENARLLAERRQTMNAAVERQQRRRQRVREGLERLDREANAICA